MLSPHETLKVAPAATQAEIQQAYRSWTKLVHPDRVETELKEFANGLMQDINQAYEAMKSGKKTASNSNNSNSLEEYFSFLRENVETNQTSKLEEQLIFPYWSIASTALYFDHQVEGPFLNLYIQRKPKGSFIVTDKGENLKFLTDVAHPRDLETVKENIDENRFPVTIKRNALQVDSDDCPSLGEAIDCMVKTIVDIDSEYDSRIHNWHQAKDFLRQRNEVALLSGELTEQDLKRGMVFQSKPFQMTRKGQKLNVMLLPDPIWIEGEIKLTRVDDPILADKNTTLFKSNGHLRYQDEFSATDEEFETLEVGKYYKLTVSGHGSFVLAAYKSM